MKKLKIGLYLDNKNIPNIDLRFPEKGNPGIGGTQFCFVLLPVYFDKVFPDKHEFIFYAHYVKFLPEKFKKIQVRSLIDAAKKAKEDNVDIFIYRPADNEECRIFLEMLNDLKLDTIAWAHNTPFLSLERIAKIKSIKRYICVGIEQYDMIRDHPIIYKTDVIFNLFDPTPFLPDKDLKKEKGLVIFLGSLIPSKGFHILAEVWKEIIKEVPYAKLIVIGSGKLYNRNIKLGKWGIAEESYEKFLKKYLADKMGKPIPSVKFMGILGHEKIQLLQKAIVGVVNPSGQTETFCISALEIQSSGTPVVSGAYWGLLDTVKDGISGFLVKNKKEFTQKIIFLLKNENKAFKMGQKGIAFVKEKFYYEKVVQKWDKVFNDIFFNIAPKIKPITQNPKFDLKQQKEFLRILKEKFPIFSSIPPLIRLRKFYKFIIKIYLK